MRTPKDHRSLCGFTLVEILIAVTIFGVVIAGAMSAFIGTLRSTHALADAIDVNARSRFIQERLLFDLRAIKSVGKMDTEMTAAEVSKVFAGYSGSEVTHCFRSFRAIVNKYEGGDSVEVTYTLVADGKDPTGEQLWALVRKDSEDPTPRRVLVNLKEGCFTFFTRRKNTGILTALGDDGAAQTNAIRFAFIPKDRGPLLPGQNDPSCSAVVQLRYPSYK